MKREGRGRGDWVYLDILMWKSIKLGLFHWLTFTFIGVILSSKSIGKPELVRQTNSLRAQQALHEIGKRLEKHPKASKPDTIGKAWIAYTKGVKGPLFEFIYKDNFDPNELVDGENTLLQAAMKRGNKSLVRLLIGLPGMDLNQVGRNLNSPIQLSSGYPEISNLLKTASRQVPGDGGINAMEKELMETRRRTRNKKKFKSD